MSRMHACAYDKCMANVQVKDFWVSRPYRWYFLYLWTKHAFIYALSKHPPLSYTFQGGCFLNTAAALSFLSHYNRHDIAQSCSNVYANFYFYLANNNYYFRGTKYYNA